MTQTITFDTHAYVKKLKAVGFTEEQAETLATTQANLIDERLATKHDIKELDTSLKRDMKELETSLKHDMKELETSLKRDIKELETSLRHDMKELETSLKRDIKESELRLIIKLGAMLTTGIIIVAALVKLL